jgi:hypothetical protein
LKHGCRMVQGSYRRGLVSVVARRLARSLLLTQNTPILSVWKNKSNCLLFPDTA